MTEPGSGLDRPNPIRVEWFSPRQQPVGSIPIVTDMCSSSFNGLSRRGERSLLEHNDEIVIVEVVVVPGLVGAHQRLPCCEMNLERAAQR